MPYLSLGTVRVQFSTWLVFPSGGEKVVDGSRLGSYIVDIVEVFFGDVDFFVRYIRYFDIDIFVFQFVESSEES